MLKKKIITALVAGTLALSMTGCGNSKVGSIELSSGQTAIHIADDETITYGVSESFGKEYYDKKVLKSNIQSEVDEFNAGGDASADGALKLKKVEVKKDVATMILEFATAYDFYTYIENYNNPDEGTFYLGSISDNDACEIEGKFYAPDDKDNLVSEDKISDLDANILIVNEKMSVEIEGTIQYVSENCTIKDGVVETADTDNGNSFIIYK